MDPIIMLPEFQHQGGVWLKSYYQLVRHDGNRELFRAVEMSIIALNDAHPFHVHAEGLRGTGKTSIMRAAKEILPPIVRIKGCIYNCHPARPHCPEHRQLSPAEIAAIGTELIPCPFLEISQSAKIGTVVGSIDLRKLTDKTKPTAALLPGTIPQAHRGIIFIDEINRLADTSPELADVLLDVMGTKPGRIQVEETGLPKVELPVNVTVWAASNPDEDPGPLPYVRKQLSDRFDLAVSMGRPGAYRDIVAILEQQGLPAGVARQQFAIPGSIRKVVAEAKIKQALANIYVDYGLESIRAVEGMETAAGLTALMRGRNDVAVEDLIAAVPLVLGHRADRSTIAGILRYLERLSEFQPAGSNTAAGPEESLAEAEFGGQPPCGRSRLKQFLASLLNRFKMKAKQRRESNAGPSNTAGRSATSSGNAGNGGPREKSSRQSANGPARGCPAGSAAGRAANQPPAGANPSPAPTNPSLIMAPPQAALPLMEHTLEQFVSGEDKK